MWFDFLHRRVNGVHHTKIQYKHMYNGLQKYSFINIMICYKDIQNNAQFQRHKKFLINGNNLTESTGRGRKKHAIGTHFHFHIKVYWIIFLG